MRQYKGYHVLLITEDLTFDGKVTGVTGGYITLESVQALAPGGEAKPVDGQVLVPTARIMWVQVLP